MIAGVLSFITSSHDKNLWELRHCFFVFRFRYLNHLLQAVFCFAMATQLIFLMTICWHVTAALWVIFSFIYYFIWFYSFLLSLFSQDHLLLLYLSSITRTQLSLAEKLNTAAQILWFMSVGWIHSPEPLILIVFDL